MKTHLDCLPCIVRQAIDAARFVTDDISLQKEIISEVMTEMVTLDYEKSPPYMAYIIHELVREKSGIKDPYREVKHKFTMFGLEIYDELKEIVNESKHPLNTAIRLSIAGNIIDYGVFENISEAEVFVSINKCLEADLSIANVNNLKNDLEKANTILFLGDNAGETVLDRFLLEEMPLEKITYVVKGSPIVNDAIMEDAKEAGLTDLLPVIDNGSNAQGTILELCSYEFNQIFNEADLIIAKGQAHYETMNDFQLGRIYHLFQAKCNVIAEEVGCNVGDMVIIKK